MVTRQSLLSEVERRLGDRRLVWAGIRGDDIEPLSDLPQLHGSFSIAGSYTKRAGISSIAYEELSGTRVDPEVWDIDDHLRAAATVEFRRGLLTTLGSASALLPYRPSQFLSAVQFARQRECLSLGLFGGLQTAFEHKPWVESEVARMGLPHVPWTYVADEEQLRARELTRQGAVVLRRSRTSGGQGFSQVGSFDELALAWPSVEEAFVSVAPFVTGLPVNVGATVWPDGVVTVHHPSVQLIGIESCVTRPFGYCGNDFGAARELGDDVVDRIETSTVRIGRWLRGHGYLGTFGVDYLVRDGEPLFTEVNPRFQGSTHASCRLSVQAGRACLMLEHVAAWLGVPGPAPVPLREIVDGTPDFANLVVHWTGPSRRQLDAESLADVLRAVDPSTRADVLTPPAVANDPGSSVGRFTMRRRLTRTGFDLDPQVDAAVARWQRDAASAGAGERGA